MTNRYLLGAGVALAVALSWADAQAQWLPMPAGPGAWYFGGEGGWTSLEDQKGKIAGTSLREKFDDGFNVGARAGYEWGPLRLEEEFRFQQNGITKLGIGNFNVAATGDRNAYAFMTNAIYDFNFGWPLTPHLGVGIGAVELRDGLGIKGLGQISHSTTWEFGYQGIAGVRYNINPSLAFDLDYRYLATTDPTFHTNFGPSYTSGYSSHSVLASLSVRFGAPPPPVAAPPLPPAPPPIAKRVFLVFFDWDRDTITPEGMQIIQQAAAAFRAGAPVTIQVTGYTDRSGSPGYNQRLSERRANNVANAMARLGVPRSQMAVSGRGENDNRVPTADGVREPQNRRVEIVFP
ncbi:MAG TPA: OmpA family protein [Stellaceae bacterium]|jgi:outer membrane protein OmpA-like peptidoglycan-associated protein|nr:OmpA family protein [Stellaceae bacterium]